MRETRLSFIGDELVAGHGDGRALGWTGRVMARTPRDADILWTSLAVPGETTAQMSDRWGPEVARRSTHTGINRLVVGLGVADVLAGISYARSRLALANILDTAASDHRECFVVGPPPLPEADPDATAQLSQAAEEVCLRRNVPYVDAFEPLRNHEQWTADVAAAGGTHPGQAGYGLLAWLVRPRGGSAWPAAERPEAVGLTPPVMTRRPDTASGDRPTSVCLRALRSARYPAQALGRLPWLALDLARARRLRPRLLITASSCLDSPHEGARNAADSRTRRRAWASLAPPTSR